MNIPSSVWRVSVHNQIHRTVYYICRRYVRGKTGFRPTKDAVGMRGNHGDLSLGMSYSRATEWATEKNRALGWNKILPFTIHA